MKTYLMPLKAALATVGVAGALAASGLAAFHHSDYISPGVRFEGEDLGGMTRQQVRGYVEDVVASGLEPPIRLSCETREWQVPPQDIHLSVDVDAIVDEAYRVGRDGNPLQNILRMVRVARRGCYVDPHATYDKEALAARLSGIAAEVLVQPVNASVTVQEDGSIRHVPGVVGKRLDVERAAQQLDSPLTDFRMPIRASLALDELQPFVKDSDVAAIDSVLSTYTTRLPSGNSGYNAAIAADQLNNVMVFSGSGLSFNATVGKRTYEAGYRDASVIVDGHFGVDVGGGVCQVATTLYNAILRAGLTATERSPHHFPSIYCPPGHDATVADGLLDFQFANPLPHNVYLLAGTSGRSLTISVLGTKADLQGNTITLENEGTRMRPTVYRVYSHDGEVVAREYLHTDAYASP